MTVLLPGFLYGSFTEVTSRAQILGRTLSLSGDELWKEADLVEVPSGSIVFLSEFNDLNRQKPAWRLYLIQHVQHSQVEVLGYAKERLAVQNFQSALMANPLGSLHLWHENAVPRDLSSTRRRLGAVIGFWHELEAFRYVGNGGFGVSSFEDLILRSTQGFRAIWSGCEPDIEPREVLANAIARSQAPARSRQLRALANLVSLTAREEGFAETSLTKDSWLENRLLKLDTVKRNLLLTGYRAEILSFVHSEAKRLGFRPT